MSLESHLIKITLNTDCPKQPLNKSRSAFFFLLKDKDQSPGAFYYKGIKDKYNKTNIKRGQDT